ncbi:methionine ABC transporter ATP-binding protein [Paenibacillus phoenicis]|uniref:Methionine ABC transporter ATP-binding protein n=1 Tax=Paenibacillus phoenicis TaxID=554117 RepID=A0ABU5PFG3_9BACL|nr:MULTISPECIES: methionine ABC transporter ATP-binding protein [Paenibacillus]MCT2193698.1 methionine ABC transporter ATP-binding protein [Paenibacillus sp. p3-SID1389]MEA3568504.1 methionine ABC transporter ATP-binding protein [Paenibacillus phoenicis]
MITLEHVSKTYSLRNGRFEALRNVSLQIPEGTIHGIIGPSGAGKSTLLRMMNALELPDQGKVTVLGQELTALPETARREVRRSIGMIFQQFHLLNNRTVSGNVSVPLELARLPKKERAERVRECLRFVGLEDKAGQYPASLSGGQKQRVAIARALASRPSILLCDEPTSSLDPKTTAEILEVLLHIHRTLGMTIVIVTHEMDVVRSICQGVSVMEEGRITDAFTLQRNDAEVGTAAMAGYHASYREQLLGGMEV